MVAPFHRIPQGGLEILDEFPAIRYACRHMDQTGTSSEGVSDSIRSGRPWWQICCGGCLLSIFAIFAGGFILLQTIAGPGVTHPSVLPSNYPKDIVPFRLSEAQSISYLEGKSKSKIRETMYAPILLFSKLLGRQTGQDVGSLADAGRSFDAFGADVQNTDSVTLTWKNVRATREEVLGYYKKTLGDANPRLETTETSDETEKSVYLSGLRVGTMVQLQIQSGSDPQVIDEVVLAVTYSNKK